MKKYLFLLLFFILLPLIIPNFIVVGEIYCEGVTRECSNEILEIVEKARGMRYFRAKIFVSKKFDSYDRVISYGVRLKLFNKMIIEVVERNPEVALLGVNGKYSLFDRHGHPVGVSQSDNGLPYAKLLNGEISRSEISALSEIIYVLNQKYSFVSGEIDHGALVFEHSGNKFIMPLSDDVDLTLGAFYLILSWLNSNPEDLRIGVTGNLSQRLEIDMRYKNPVIRRI